MKLTNCMVSIISLTYRVHVVNISRIRTTHNVQFTIYENGPKNKTVQVNGENAFEIIPFIHCGIVFPKCDSIWMRVA